MPVVKTNVLAERRRDRLQRIYQAFEELIADRGYAAVTLTDVAEQAGLARTSIYKYFDTKDSLLLGFTGRELDSYHSQLRVDLARADDPFDQLDIFVSGQITYFATHHAPSGPALRSILPADVYSRLQHHAVVLEETLRAILDQAANEQMIERDVADDPNIVRLIQSCLAATAGRPLNSRDLKILIATTQTFVRRAIGAGPPAA